MKLKAVESLGACVLLMVEFLFARGLKLLYTCWSQFLVTFDLMQHIYVVEIY